MRSKYLAIFAIVVVFVVGFLASSAFLTFKTTIGQVIVTANPGTGTPSTPSPTPDPLAPYGVLLLGLRGDGSIGGTLTDTMLLGVINPKERAVNLISIPRDLWVPIPVSEGKTEHFKINAAYAIGMDDRNYPNKEAQFKGAAGGGQMAKHIIQDVTGIPVRYFISLDFEGFRKSIDILGGVDVSVSKSFEDPYYPLAEHETDTCGKSDEDVKALTATMSGDLLEHSFPCRYETLKFDKGVVHMDGETALKFARSRHSLSDGTDFARSNRQKEILQAVKDKILQVGFLPRAIPFVQSLSGDLRTDIPLEVMTTLASQVNDFKSYSISSVALSTDNALTQTYSADRQYILVSKSGLDDWQSIRDYISSQATKASPKP